MPDEPISAEYVAKMHGIMGVIDEVFNETAKGAERKIGVILLVFPMNDENATGQCVNYMSNGPDRDDVRAMFKEILARWEGQSLIEGQA